MMNKRQKGFSLVELMVVILIIMVISALAMPNVIRGIGSLRLRGAGSNVSGLLQRARIQAVRTNRIQLVRQATITGAQLLYVDGPAQNGHTAYNSTPDSDEPVVQISDSVELQTANTGPMANFTSNANTLVGFDISTPTTGYMAFNQRGLPCAPTMVSGQPTTCTTTAGYVYFYRSTGAFGGQCIAISVTPAGRIRVWSWDGTKWS